MTFSERLEKEISAALAALAEPEATDPKDELTEARAERDEGIKERIPKVCPICIVTPMVCPVCERYDERHAALTKIVESLATSLLTILSIGTDELEDRTP